MSDGLIIPAVFLALIAWLVPKLLSMVMPEGKRALMILAFVSTLVLFAISAGFFFVLYLWNGMPVSDIAEFGWRQNIIFFGKLGMIAALIWAPIMIVSVAGLPRTWKRAIW